MTDKAQQILGRWADIEAANIVDDYFYNHGGQMGWLKRTIADALRKERSESEARGRRNAIERSAALIGRQVEPRDA